jgi:hypothetical protein
MASDDVKKPDGGTQTGFSRLVVWTGIACGTAFMILLETQGVTPPRIGGVPSWAGVMLGVIIVYLAIVIAAITAAELTRRHHETVYHAAQRRGRSGWDRVHAGAQRRWAARKTGPARPSRFRRGTGGDKDRRSATLPDPPKPKSSTGGGSPAPTGGTLVPDRHSRIAPDRRARRIAGRIDPATVPAAWRSVIARAADFDPENDGMLLDWMAGEIAGIIGYAEALVEAHQNGVVRIGLDPRALQVLYDAADAVASAGQTMLRAKRSFAEHYELPREYAADGGIMPHDGRFIQGEGS